MIVCVFSLNGFCYLSQTATIYVGSTKSVTFSLNFLRTNTLKYGALCMSWQAIVRLLRGHYICELVLMNDSLALILRLMRSLYHIKITMILELYRVLS